MRFELMTFRLSAGCSTSLSYGPVENTITGGKGRLAAPLPFKGFRGSGVPFPRRSEALPAGASNRIAFLLLRAPAARGCPSLRAARAHAAASAPPRTVGAGRAPRRRSRGGSPRRRHATHA